MIRKKQSIKNRKSNPMTGRVKFIFCFALLIVAGFLVRLFYLQVWAGTPFRDAALLQRRRSVEVEAKRGSIFDRKNQPLALSVTVNTVRVFPKQVTSEKRRETAELYAYILGLDVGEVEKKLAATSSSVVLKSKLSQTEVDRLQSSGLRSYKIEQEQERFYPNKQILGQTLGFVNDEGKGIYGIEASYDALLLGKPGQNTYSRDTQGNVIPTETQEKVASREGANVSLTIDLDWQKVLSEELRRGQRDFATDMVGAIMIDPNTGEILAMDSTPTFDPNEPNAPLSDMPQETWKALSGKEQMQQRYARWKNPMVSDVYEPGSVFKTITASVSLETKSNKPESRYLCEGKLEVVPGVWIHCWREEDPHGWQTLEEAINNSCNPAFVQIVREIGPAPFHSYLKTAHIGGKTGIDLPAEAMSVMPKTTEEMSAVRMATMSYGHGLSVTPMGMLSAACATINGGYYRTPHLFRQATNQAGDVVSSYQAKQPDPIFSKETSETMRQYLLSTTLKNKANVTRIQGVSIGTKSGTTLLLENGKYSDKTMASFFSFYPADNPKVAMLVVAKNPKTNIFGGVVAGEITARILERTIGMGTQTTKQQTKRVPDLQGKTVAEARRMLQEAGIQLTVFGAMNEQTLIERQAPAAGSLVNSETVVSVYPDEQRSFRVPDLSGMSRDNATKLLETAGIAFTFETEARGAIVSQMPKADTIAAGQTTIVLVPSNHEGAPKEQLDPPPTNEDGVIPVQPSGTNREESGAATSHKGESE